MKSTTRALALLAALALAGCAGAVRETPDGTTGLDTRPEGPSLTGVRAADDGAAVSPAGVDGRIQVRFPEGAGRPAALLSFAATDINDRLGVAVDVANPGNQDVRVFADLNEDTWVRGYVTVPPGRTRTLYVFARRLRLSPADAAEFPLMHGIPGGKMSLWAGIEEPIVARDLKIFMVMPRGATRILVGNIRPFGSSRVPDAAGFFPFIDRYGQYSHKEWPGKVHSDADFAASIRREDPDLAAHAGAPGLDQYGGWAAGPQLRPTGRFRTEKYQGKWWLVDPEGRLFWSDGIDGVGFTKSLTRIQGRERFYQDPPPDGDFLARNLQVKYGADWASAARERDFTRLKSWGINTLGAWSDLSFLQRHRMPYTLEIPSTERGTPINPDDPAWHDGMRRSLESAAALAKDDPWCIGYFVDNEIHASTDPDWFERYYRQVSSAGRELMPDTLYLGSRLDYHDWPDVPEARRQIVRVAARYCDVVSFNFYKFTLDDVALPEGIDRPAIVGEFHMGALDRGKFHTGLRSVIDQRQRAEAYRYYVQSALRNPAIVGAHWFQMYDESTTGRFDGENYQIGFLDTCDTPYDETTGAARGVAYGMYSLRSGAE